MKESSMASLENKTSGITVYVTDAHIHHKGIWIYHCKELGISEQVLNKAYDTKSAMYQACNIIRGRLINMQQGLDQINSEMREWQ